MKQFRHPLAREIAAALLVKLIVIAGLYLAFFSDHASKPGDADVARHLSNPSQR